MNKITNIILGLTAKLKPILVKVVPIDWLRSIKYRLVTTSSNGISNAKPEPFVRAENPDGVNLIGNIRGEIGLGQSNRLVAGELANTNFPYTIFNHEQIASLRNDDKSMDDKITNTTPYNINLIHVNPYEMGLMYLQLDPKIWDKRYNIGFWLWELEEFPDEWLPAISLIDEIWVPSDFAGIAMKKVTDKPIITIPYAIEANIDQSIKRERFHLPEDKFLFLSMYDSNSTMERKNPIGAIHSYKKAFPTERADCGLVVKVNNAKKEDLEILRKELEGYENVYFITETLQKAEVDSLVALVDVFVSLHRAEGFGLVLAEAMLVGTPCIATNWSSNTEFMNENVACMVDYEMTKIKEDVGPYQKGWDWAEPSTDHAAAHMKRLIEDKAYYEKLASDAKIYVEEKLGMKQATEKINARVLEIYQSAQQ